MDYSQGLLPDPSHFNFEGDFETQVKNLTELVRLTREEVEALRTLFEQLEGALQIIWRGCKIMPFGSIITGLGIKSSDVDCFVEIPKHYSLKHKPPVIEARNILRQFPHLFQELFAITTAKVPIVKFYHVPTDRRGDISFKSQSGVRNSKLTAYLLHLDDRALPLAVIIKYWAKVHEMTGTNLLPNYALTMLVIFYLQQINILPSVVELQKTDRLMVDDWNMAFEPIHYRTYNKHTLHQLLGGFFKFYSNFNFDENIVSPFLGKPIPRSSFKNIEEVPEEYCLYLSNVSSGICKPLRVDTKLCVQDPFEHSRNCAMCVYPRLAMTLVSYFKFGAQLFEDLSPEAFFKGLFLRKPPINQMVHLNQVPENFNKKKKPSSNTSPINKGRITKYKDAKKTFNFEEIYTQIRHKKRGKNFKVT